MAISSGTSRAGVTVGASDNGSLVVLRALSGPAQQLRQGCGE
jgi:hypothetical protein